MILLSNDLVVIDLYCREMKGTYKVDIVDKEEDVPEEHRDKYKLVRFFMKPLTWKLHTDLIRKATYLRKFKGMKGKGMGGSVEEIDWCLYRQNKALLTIDSWNIVDDNGEKVEVNDETIMSMNPTVLERLLDRYDSEVMVSKEREKTLILKTFKYYNATNSGNGAVEAPPEVVELSLMEKFNWTPQQISEIPYHKIQELFIILSQRDKSQSAQ
jgi:hypothetical protein